MYVLKDEYRIRDGHVPGESIPRFVITGEISSIYKKNDKVRKVHSLILLPRPGRCGTDICEAGTDRKHSF